MGTAAGSLVPVGVSSRPELAGAAAGRGSSRCSRAHPAAVGAVFSSAHASRCRSMGTCASQQSTLQKANPVPLRLHVETLHAKYGARKSIGFLQVLQRFQRVSSLMGETLRESRALG